MQIVTQVPGPFMSTTSANGSGPGSTSGRTAMCHTQNSKLNMTLSGVVSQLCPTARARGSSTVWTLLHPYRLASNSAALPTLYASPDDT